MALADAAYDVLRGSSDGRPLSGRQIAEIAIKRRLVRGELSDIARSLRGALIREQRQRDSEGLRPRMRSLGQGQYSLGERKLEPELYTAERDLIDRLSRTREATRVALRRRLRSMAAGPFELMMRLLLERMGIAAPGTRSKVDLAAMRAQAEARRQWPDDVDFDLAVLVERMTRLLLIEISAFHTFAWAEEILDDRDLVAGEGEAARMVSYIRQDETPHVDYLRTVLSEMRDRTVVGAGGRRHAGADLVGATWDRAVAQSVGPGRIETLDVVRREVDHAMAGRPDRDDLMARFDELGDVVRAADGTWSNTGGRAA